MHSLQVSCLNRSKNLARSLDPCLKCVPCKIFTGNAFLAEILQGINCVSLGDLTRIICPCKILARIAFACKIFKECNKC